MEKCDNPSNKTICEIDGKKFNCNEIFKHQYAFSDVASKDIKTIMIPPEKFLLTTYKECMARKLKAKTPTWQPYEYYVCSVLVDERVEGIKKSITNREKHFPIPFLTFDEEGKPIGHEGRHTAKATEELGFKEIPVTIEKPKSVKIDYEEYETYGEQYGD